MNQSKSVRGAQTTAARQLVWVLLCLILLLGFLFRDGLRPSRTVFSNDGPLGAISSHCGELPAGFFGFWQDLNWIGGTGPSAAPDITQGLAMVCSKLIFSKIYAPFSLLFLGLSAWLCFRQWKLSPLACFLGALAASLNSDFFSTACWGVASQPLSFGLDFLALAALADQSSPRRWLKAALAGLAVGLSVMEAFDIGAIFSVVVAGYVLFQAVAGEGATLQKVGRGAGRLALVVVFAAFIAASAVTSLVGTQIKGVANMGQDTGSKAARWDEATQWSLPKRETLGLFVPGLFGFRMDTPDGGSYWGGGGRSPVWDRYFASGKEGPPPNPRIYFLRYGGGGVYAGVLVVLMALWAALQSLRKEHSVFSAAERKAIWFWSAVALIALLVAFGRFAPFYQFFYALPFASTIRNPAKFAHVVEWGLVILFAYGAHGLSRRGLEAPNGALRDLPSQLRTWWAKAAVFDKNWVRGSAIALATSLLGWLIYSSSRDRLVEYLREMATLEGRGPEDAAALAQAVSGFSIRQVGWFALLLALALGLVTLILSGYFSGRRARLGGILLGVLLVADLGWADMPWVVTWNWEQKYATNPVIDLLREKPYEHRVVMLPFRAPQQLSLFSQLYDIEWKQQLFPYYNIQCLDYIMNPRPREDEVAFETALFFDGTTNTLHKVARRWELTNTRYLLGAAGFLDLLNQQIDPLQHRFRILTRFDIAAKPGVPNPSGLDELTAVIKPDGAYAVFDFTGALPRAKLYANWQVSTNDSVTLTNLPSAGFNPAQTVLVADPLPAPGPGSVTNQNAGTVDFASYAPKRIVLRAKANAPAVLLLNDRFDPNWKVAVDGKPEKVLRCNYLMRGVYLQPGAHTVEFRFEPPVDTLYVSLGAVAVGLAMCVFLALCPGERPPAAPARDTPAGKL